jgi:hypothetical protein
VNAFVGDHVECSDVGEALAYSIACIASAGGCEVTVACRCGATTSFASTPGDAEALTAVATRYQIPTQITGEDVDATAGSTEASRGLRWRSVGRDR